MEQTEIKQQLKVQGEMIKEIHIVIAGNPQYGQKGIKDHFEAIDTRFSEHDTRFDDQDKKIVKMDADNKRRSMKYGFFGAGIGSAVTAAAYKTGLIKVWTIIASFF